VSLARVLFAPWERGKSKGSRKSGSYCVRAFISGREEQFKTAKWSSGTL
jgi:hypothetical protein